MESEERKVVGADTAPGYGLAFLLLRRVVARGP
jgi:hypothetical protein